MADNKNKLSTPLEILQAALHKEKDAYAFYDGLLKGSTVQFVGELLEELRDAEYHHMKKIEHMITSLQQ